jgi:hypothetical protein
VFLPPFGAPVTTPVTFILDVLVGFRSGPLLFTVAGMEITATVAFTLICFPVFVLKQMISVVQLFSACHTIVSVDQLDIMKNKTK